MTLVESNCSQTRFPTKNSLYEQLSIMKCHVKQLEKYGKEYAQEHLQEMEKQAYRLENIYYYLFKKLYKPWIERKILKVFCLTEILVNALFAEVKNLIFLL